MVDDEWRWCIVFSDKQFGYTRLSDMEADTTGSQAGLALTAQTAGPTITDQDLATVIDYENALIHDPPRSTTASSNLLLDFAYSHSIAVVLPLLLGEQELPFISETCHIPWLVAPDRADLMSCSRPCEARCSRQRVRVSNIVTKVAREVRCLVVSSCDTAPRTLSSSFSV